MSNVLELSKILQIEAYSQIDIPDISLPYFNGIVSYDIDNTNGSSLIYYGDEVDLKFWKKLDMEFGSIDGTSTIYSLYDGWKYKYFYNTKKFIIEDENGNIVEEKDDVTTISDFDIDFSVHKSHQFEIHFKSGNKKFYKVAVWSKHFHNVIRKEFNRGVQNIVIPDRVRPYLPTDEDNPTWEIKHLANLDYYGFFGNNLFGEPDGEPYDPNNPWEPSNPGSGIGGSPMPFRYNPIDAEGIRILNAINWDKLQVENNWYAEGLYRLIAFNVGLPAYGHVIKYPWIILPLISMGLYPLLNNLQLPESVYNNRPVYEPWLIWKILKFINTGYTKDIFVEFPVPVFDLSPRFE